jgi:hypothetical protein
MFGSNSQLNDVLLAVQCPLDLCLHGDDANRPRFLEIEVGVARNGHEIDVTWLPQDDMVGSGEVDHHVGECLDAVVVHISKGDRQINLPEGDGLFAWDHSVEWVQAILEHVLAQP